MSIQLSELKKETKYSTLDIVKALDIPRERLRDWMNRGYIVPTLPAHGHGTKAGFTKGDVYGIALFRKLVEKGFKRELAAEFTKKYVGSGSPLGFTSYIMFKTVIENREPIIKPIFFAGPAPFTINIDLNQVSLQELQEVYSEVWDDIYIINFVKIATEIDAALAKIE
jgi:hypothetical protein